MAVSLRPGDVLGRYTLTSRLARGGMGEVWLATASGSSGFEKRLVLKTILPERSDAKQYIDLFAQEARLTAKLHHPNLVEVFDFAEDKGVFYLVMEYLPGRSLSQTLNAAIARGESLPDWFCLHVLVDCCRGLDYAHEQSGIIHCDLSPGNVMLSFSGPSKIVDFGVAFQRGSRTGDGQLKGKLAYMAPERIRDNQSDRRSDVYSLGVVMYLLFCGRLPFRHKNPEALALAITTGEAQAPSVIRPVSRDIETIIKKSMARDPVNRYPSAAAMGAALSAVLAQHARLNLQLDVATFLSSLFPDCDEVPASIRARLASGTLSQPLSRSALGVLEIPTGQSYGALGSNDEASVVEMEISLDDSDVVIVDSSDFDLLSGNSGVAALFEASSKAESTPAPRRPLPVADDSRPGHSGIFDGKTKQRAAPVSGATIFDSTPRRRESDQRDWPWTKRKA